MAIKIPPINGLNGAYLMIDANSLVQKCIDLENNQELSPKIIPVSAAQRRFIIPISGTIGILYWVCETFHAVHVKSAIKAVIRLGNKASDFILPKNITSNANTAPARECQILQQNLR